MRDILFITSFFIAAVMSGCGGAASDRTGNRTGEAAGPVAVEAVQARSGVLPLEQRFSGVVHAENQITIHSEIAAQVVRVAAQNGDVVRSGQPLVYLRDRQFLEQLRQAQAALEISRAEATRAEAVLRELRTRLARTEELAAKQYQSRQELEAIQAQVDGAAAQHQQALGRIAQASATVEEREEALRQTVIRAPISGHVGDRNVELGMRVDTGTRLFTIGNLDVVRIEVPIPGALLGRIAVGQSALISASDRQDQLIRAEVSRISPFLEAGSFSAKAEVDVSNHAQVLRPGMFVTVDIHYGESQQATLVPLGALYENPSTGVVGVYVAPTLGTEVPVDMPEVFDPQAPPPLTDLMSLSFRPVTVLARGREMAGVQGISAGAWVVTVGQNLLHQQRGGTVEARVRPIPWERVASLQRLQDQDLLREFMAKQQRIAHQSMDVPGNDSSVRTIADPAP